MINIKKTSLIIILSILSILTAPSLLFLIFIFTSSNIIASTTRKYSSAIAISILLIVPIIGSASVVIDFFSKDAREFSFIYAIFLVINIYLSSIKTTTIEVKSFDYGDYAAVLVSGLVLLILLVPFELSTPVKQLIITSTGGDAANHFMMFNYNLLNQSPSYFNNDARMLDILIRYPQSLHTSMAVVFHGMNVGDDTINKVRFYYYTTIIYSAITAFFFTKCVYVVSQKNKLISFIVGLSIYPLVITFLIRWGFLTQIVAFCYLFSMLYYMSKNGIEGRYCFWVVLSTLAAGLSGTWYLLLIPATLSLTSEIKKYSHHIKKISLISIVAIPAILIEPILNINSSSNDLIKMLPEKYASNPSPLLLPGSVFIYNSATITFAFAAFIGLLAYFKVRKLGGKIPPSILFGSLASFLMTFAIAIYQINEVSELRYYFYKMLFLVISCSLIALAYYSNLLMKKNKKLTNFLSILFTIAIISCLTLTNSNSPAMAIQKGVNVGDFFGNKILYTKTNEDTVFVSNCNALGAQISNNWINAMHLNNTFIKREKAKEINNNLIDYRKNKNVVFDECLTR